MSRTTSFGDQLIRNGLTSPLRDDGYRGDERSPFTKRLTVYDAFPKVSFDLQVLLVYRVSFSTSCEQCIFVVA